MIVKNHDSLDEIGHDLSVMYYSVAGFTTVLLVLIILCEYNRATVLITQKCLELSGHCSSEVHECTALNNM